MHEVAAHQLASAWGRSVAPAANGETIRISRSRYVTDAPYPAVVVPYDAWHALTRGGEAVTVQHRTRRQARDACATVLDDAEYRGVHTIVARDDGWRVVIAPYAWWSELDE